MKSKIYITILICTLSFSGFGQIGIGTTSPDASAVLDMTSTTQGVLIPRMTTSQRTAIAAPAIGLQVYDSDTNSVWLYNGASWMDGTGGAGKFIDGASSDIAYYDGRVGIGRDNFSAAHQLWVEGVKSTDDANTATLINAEYTGSGTNVSTYALANQVSNAGSGTIGFAIGNRNTINNTNGGTISAADITRLEVNNSANLDFITGTGIYFDNTGTVGTAFGQIFSFVGAGTVENSYAIFISSTFNKGTNNNYSIYSGSDADSYLEGSLGIGTDAPQQKVHISGAMRLEPQATAPTGTLGDLYVGTDGNLYFNDGSAGTGWRQVQLVP